MPKIEAAYCPVPEGLPEKRKSGQTSKDF